MPPTGAFAQEPSPHSSLSIGDLARRTGVSTATLRMWETRHGFPIPQRLASGHRRYAEADVATVEQVCRRRDAGVRLEVAIAEVLEQSITTTPSIFAVLRQRHPGLATQHLTKSTLLALSWAIEDEFCARARPAHLFGAFQEERHYRPAADRWTELARVAGSAMVFADFPEGTASGAAPTRVALGPREPMRREWAVICDSTDLPVTLSAFEIPGQTGTPEGQRIFEAIWTVEPRAVRDAARVCAQVAEQHGVAEATPLLRQLAHEPVGSPLDAAAVTSLFTRLLVYVDRHRA